MEAYPSVLPGPMVESSRIPPFKTLDPEPPDPEHSHVDNSTPYGHVWIRIVAAYSSCD